MTTRDSTPGGDSRGADDSRRPNQPSLTTIPNAAARWELDALNRLVTVREVADCIICGHVAADPELVDHLARLVASAADRLRWRDACQEQAA